MRVNTNKTKWRTSEANARWPCGVCGRGVSSNVLNHVEGIGS